jgi:hypothetical protein
MSSRVVITASHLPKFAYGALSEDEKRTLVDYLMAARAHVLIDQWCLADHFLPACSIILKYRKALRQRLKQLV